VIGIIARTPTGSSPWAGLPLIDVRIASISLVLDADNLAGLTISG
jgi:hypothetical protein